MFLSADHLRDRPYNGRRQFSRLFRPDHGDVHRFPESDAATYGQSALSQQENDTGSAASLINFMGLFMGGIGMFLILFGNRGPHIKPRPHADCCWGGLRQPLADDPGAVIYLSAGLSLLPFLICGIAVQKVLGS